jgi:hypothetical protein
MAFMLRAASFDAANLCFECFKGEIMKRVLAIFALLGVIGARPVFAQRPGNNPVVTRIPGQVQVVCPSRSPRGGGVSDLHVRWISHTGALNRKAVYTQRSHKFNIDSSDFCNPNSFSIEVQCDTRIGRSRLTESNVVEATSACPR